MEIFINLPAAGTAPSPSIPSATNGGLRSAAHHAAKKKGGIALPGLSDQPAADEAAKEPGEVANAHLDAPAAVDAVGVDTNASADFELGDEVAELAMPAPKPVVPKLSKLHSLANTDFDLDEDVVNMAPLPPDDSPMVSHESTPHPYFSPTSP